MNFGALQRAFSKRCIRLIIEGREVHAKDDLREYIDYLQSKEPLIEQFHVYENFYHHTEADRDLAIMFVKNTLAQLESLTRGDVLTFNTLLKHKFDLHEDNTPLDEAINILIEAKISDFDYDTSRTANAFKTVLKHTMAEKDEPRPLEELTAKHNQFADANLEFFTPQRVVRIGIEKFNKEFGPLFTVAERAMFKKLQHIDSHETLIELYNTEFKSLRKILTEFRSQNLDDSLVTNLELAEQKLAGEPSVDKLLNIFELYMQIKALRNDNETD
jgi:hypothetical protein